MVFCLVQILLQLGNHYFPIFVPASRKSKTYYKHTVCCTNNNLISTKYGHTVMQLSLYGLQYLRSRSIHLEMSASYCAVMRSVVAWSSLYCLPDEVVDGAGT